MDYSDLPGFAVAFTGNDTIYSHATGALLKKHWENYSLIRTSPVRGIPVNTWFTIFLRHLDNQNLTARPICFLSINVYMSLTLSHRQILEYPRLSISSIVCTLIKTCIAQCSINTWHGNYAEQRFSPRDSSQVPAKLHHTYRSTTAIMESYCRG
ncbi:hypothetical protein BMETH_989_0 [methanotrophic bacterial endosymbiont of Bathymodiolus sp.]|nr:hypothetical protein BMETH_989_0 [methanotrophic bacterial endosymbiont of Bathymodiolus sp.]